MWYQSSSKWAWVSGEGELPLLEGAWPDVCGADLSGGLNGCFMAFLPEPTSSTIPATSLWVTHFPMAETQYPKPTIHRSASGSQSVEISVHVTWLQGSWPDRRAAQGMQRKKQRAKSGAPPLPGHAQGLLLPPGPAPSAVSLSP